MANKASEVLDLSAEDTTKQTQALQALERNFSHMLISSQEAEGKTGPKITFGDKVLTFRPAIPSTAMTELLGNDNKIEGLRNYVRLSLQPESRPTFEELQDDLPLDALNMIVETISEAAVPLDTAKP
jgi:hypothetical protein